MMTSIRQRRPSVREWLPGWGGSWALWLVDDGRHLVEPVGGGDPFFAGPGEVLLAHPGQRFRVIPPDGSSWRVMRFDVIHRARRQDKLFWHRAPGSPKQPTARECYGCDLPARLPEAWRERAAHLITTCTDGWWRDNRRGFRANQRLAAWLDLVVNLVWSDDNPEAGDPLVLAAEAYAREAFAAGCTVADCARHVGLSRAQFHERYRRCRKEGPGTFLRCLRLASAEQLLLTSTNTVARIARQVGFNSASTFARAFRARSGFSPDEWRRRGA